MKTKFYTIYTLLIVAIISFSALFVALTVRTSFVSAYDGSGIIREDFQDYTVDANLDTVSSFQATWLIHATTSPGTMTVVNDPEDPSNKVASVVAGNYFNITPRDLKARNFTISYRVMPQQTIGTHWV